MRFEVRQEFGNHRLLDLWHFFRIGVNSPAILWQSAGERFAPFLNQVLSRALLKALRSRLHRKSESAC